MNAKTYQLDNNLTAIFDIHASRIDIYVMMGNDIDTAHAIGYRDYEGDVIDAIVDIIINHADSMANDYWAQRADVFAETMDAVKW